MWGQPRFPLLYWDKDGTGGRMAEKQDPLSKDVYEIVIKGYLDDKWTIWFGGLAISHMNDASTTLSGALPDQTALHSILNKIRDMNLTLESVQHIKTAEEET
jgi:hypothetical protein